MNPLQQRADTIERIRERNGRGRERLCLFSISFEKFKLFFLKESELETALGDSDELDKGITETVLNTSC